MKTAHPAPPAVSNWTDADAFYEALLDAHAGLTREQSEALNARLVLTLAHEVGDIQALMKCLATAQDAA